MGSLVRRLTSRKCWNKPSCDRLVVVWRNLQGRVSAGFLRLLCQVNCFARGIASCSRHDMICVPLRIPQTGAMTSICSL